MDENEMRGRQLREGEERWKMTAAARRRKRKICSFTEASLLFPQIMFSAVRTGSSRGPSGAALYALAYLPHVKSQKVPK